MKLRLKREIDLANCTLLEACWVLSGGKFNKARSVAMFVISWQMTTEQIGRRPTQAEFGDYWNMSRRTVERDIAVFREVFSKCDTPNDLPASAAHDPLDHEDYSWALAA